MEPKPAAVAGVAEILPTEGVWLVYRDVRAPVQLCPALRAVPESPVSPDGAVGTGWQRKGVGL